MFLGDSRMRLFAPLLLFAAASCAGGSHQALPSGTANAAALNASQTYTLSSTGVNASITLQSNTALPASNVTFYSQAASNARAPQTLGSACPTVPPIRLANPFGFPITVRIVSFTVKLPCTVTGSLFGASFYQVRPLPQLVSPVKLGDVLANGSTITFTPSVTSFTLAAHTTSQITVLPESSTSEVAFPVAPGSTTDLTANASNLPSGLQFTYNTATGGTTYSVACFNAFDSGGNLVPALQNVPLVGTPSFYCHMNPANGSAITFGQLVTFDIVKPKPDRAIFEPDGPVTGFECTLSNSCNVPQFTVPTTYQNFIASNALDIAMCVPATPNVDCNNANGDTQGGSRTTVSAGQDFQLLVADDPTYKPGTEAHPVPWDGLFRMTLAGPCQLNNGADNENGDVPPGYTDSGQTGVGPYAEFDVTPTGTGTCTITATEDGRYITDYSDPNNPKPRSLTIAITLQSYNAP